SLVNEEMTDQEIEALREKFGLNKPILVRYGEYVWGMLHGDLGTSYTTKFKVWDLFWQRFPNTFWLALSSTFVCWIIALPLGIISARRAGGIIDNICNVIGVIGLATPNFWLGLLLILLFAVKLHWLPAMGFTQGIKSLILPAFTIGTGQTATLMRITRSSMVEALHQDYLRTARAKGVSERRVVNRHALRNAGIPILNIALGVFIGNFAGAMLTEQVFSFPGIGVMIVQSVNSRDIPMACGFITMKCIIITILGTLRDMAFVLVDPRVKSMYVSDKKRKKKQLAEKKTSANAA
ncbi:MAG: ABC transporter permease, partial [Firmicutes bacterium]|nr:ABC transporter permease [Bacillota bacterium]